MARLILHRLACIRQEDATFDDDAILKVNGSQVWYEKMDEGQERSIDKPVSFDGEVRVELFENDWPDGDDLLGSVTIRSDSEVTERQCSFQKNDADYLLTYSVRLAAKECAAQDPDAGAIVCAEPPPGTAVGRSPSCEAGNPVEPCPVSRLQVAVVAVQEEDTTAAPQPVEGAVVEVCPLGLAMVTDSTGIVDFCEVNPGVYSISAKKSAEFPPRTFVRTIVPGENAFVEMVLERPKLLFQSQESGGAFVDANDLHFLIGEDRRLSVRLRTPVIEGTTHWKVTPVANRSGTVNPNTYEGNQFDFTPQVTAAQRPVTASRAPNDPVAYEVYVRITVDGDEWTATDRIEQDERDIIRQEYVDFKLFRAGFTLDVPSRAQIVAPNPAELGARCNYNLVIDDGMREICQAVEAAYGAKFADHIRVSSGWRNPRRNRAAGGVVNSRHQRGRAVDLQARVGGATVNRRRMLLRLYRAALPQGNEILFEQGGTLLYPPNTDFPRPSAADPDTDSDGLSDNATHNGRNLREIFNDATHVHAGNR